MYILVNPISQFQDKVFMILLHSLAEIQLLKKAYKNYERIIGDLEFDGRNVLIKNEKVHLTYVRKIVNYFRKQKFCQKNR